MNNEVKNTTSIRFKMDKRISVDSHEKVRARVMNLRSNQLRLMWVGDVIEIFYSLFCVLLGGPSIPGPAM